VAEKPHPDWEFSFLVFFSQPDACVRLCGLPECDKRARVCHVRPLSAAQGRLFLSDGRSGDRAPGQASPRRPQAPPLVNCGKWRAYGEKDDFIRRKYATLFSFASNYRFA
jgi:hypothetical protein